MTRQYEAVYVFDSSLEDAAITEKLGRFHGLLGNPGDLTLNHWGRRQREEESSPTSLGCGPRCTRGRLLRRRALGHRYGCVPRM